MAFGETAPKARRLAPVAAGLLATVLIVAGLALAPSAFSDFSIYLPWAVAVLAAASLLAILVSSRRRTDPRPSVVPALIGLLVVVSTVPVFQAGAELIVTRTSAGDFVDRLTGTDVSLLEVGALAFRVPFEAPPRDSGEPTWFYAVRDSLDDPRVALVRSAVPPGGFEERSVVARVLVDPTRVANARAALDRHGWLPDDLADTAGMYLAEETSPAGSVRSIGSASDLAGLDAGTLVRIRLGFSGTGIAACEASGSGADAAASACSARSLAIGGGGFLQVVTDDDRRPVLLHTSYPASDIPIHVVGRQVRAQAELESLLTQPWVSRLMGWANVLEFAYLDHDPRLPVDRLWLAPLVFLLLAGLLLAGRRIGYPIFELEAGPADRFATAGPPTGAGAINARVSGRLARLRGGPLDIADLPGVLEPDRGTGPRLRVELPDGPYEVPLPSTGGAMTNLDRGLVHTVRTRRPALWLHWFGSDARLVFADAATRDRAEALLAPLREPPGRRRRGQERS
jgi:hypothetical protein